MSEDKIENLKTVLAQGEKHFQAQRQIFLSTDSRVTSLLTSIITLLASAMGATVYFVERGQPTLWVPLAVLSSGFLVSVMLLSSIFAPQKTWIEGNIPENWGDNFDDIEYLEKNLQDEFKNYSNALRKNNDSIEKNTKGFRCSINIAISSLVGALLTYFSLSKFQAVLEPIGAFTVQPTF